MGNKRSCTCGCWSEVQQECLYTGGGCFYDDERKKLTVSKEFVERWWIKFKEQQVKQPGQLANLIKEMINELGLEVVEG